MAIFPSRRPIRTPHVGAEMLTLGDLGDMLAGWQAESFSVIRSDSLWVATVKLSGRDAVKADNADLGRAVRLALAMARDAHDGASS